MREHGNKGNQNAAKDDKTDTMMSFRCKQEDRQEWIKQSQKEAHKVTQWII
jgi:hypothetical protein